MDELAKRRDLAAGMKGLGQMLREARQDDAVAPPQPRRISTLVKPDELYAVGYLAMHATEVLGSDGEEGNTVQALSLGLDVQTFAGDRCVGAILELYFAGIPADPVALIEVLKEKGWWGSVEAIGGVEYIAACFEEVERRHADEDGR